MPRGSGRRPKPTALKKLQGNPGKRPLNEREPVPAKGEPEMPENLDEVAQREWRSIVPKLSELGVLSDIDGKALAAYCDCYARWVNAQKLIARLGVVIVEPIINAKGKKLGARVKKNPAVTVAERSLQLMRAFLTEFGMTPSSRSRLAVAVGGYDPVKKRSKPVEDPGEKYFGSSQTIQ